MSDVCLGDLDQCLLDPLLGVHGRLWFQPDLEPKELLAHHVRGLVEDRGRGEGVLVLVIALAPAFLSLGDQLEVGGSGGLGGGVPARPRGRGQGLFSVVNTFFFSGGF